MIISKLTTQRLKQASKRWSENLQALRIEKGPSQSVARDPIDVQRVIGESLSRAGLQAFSMPGSGSATTAVESASAGTFAQESLATPWGKLEYKLYVPSPAATSTALRPLIVMLHGCTQSPDDFAAGTQMNALAEKQGFCVLYPAQSREVNANRCWNWFRRGDQVRGSGEPAMLAAVTNHIARVHAIDPQRIFAAGLSAGAAMAIILGRTYPELYAAIGSHSGLRYGAAEDVASAFKAMRGNGSMRAFVAAPAQPQDRLNPKRTIIFHGDQDRTVDESNSLQIATDALGSASIPANWTTVVRDGTQNGARFERTLTVDDRGEVMLERWSVAGAGHAWSGGDPRGSYAASSGPHASNEMVRFFLTPYVQ